MSDWKSRRMTTAEAADYLGYATSSLNMLRTEGTGPEYLKVGRRVWYDQADLDRWLDTKRRTQTPSRIKKVNAEHAA